LLQQGCATVGLVNILVDQQRRIIPASAGHLLGTRFVAPVVDRGVSSDTLQQNEIAWPAILIHHSHIKHHMVRVRVFLTQTDDLDTVRIGLRKSRCPTKISKFVQNTITDCLRQNGPTPTEKELQRRTKRKSEWHHRASQRRTRRSMVHAKPGRAKCLISIICATPDTDTAWGYIHRLS
jgi:hypothetical protein